MVGYYGRGLSLLPPNFLLLWKERKKLLKVRSPNLRLLFNHIFYSVCTISPLSSPTLFFRSFRSAICNPERSHWMGMPRITNGGPERARKRTLGERERVDRANIEYNITSFDKEGLTGEVVIKFNSNRLSRIRITLYLWCHVSCKCPKL